MAQCPDLPGKASRSWVSAGGSGSERAAPCAPCLCSLRPESHAAQAHSPPRGHMQRQATLSTGVKASQVSDAA